MKKLRTDNGLEFCSIEFNQYCIREGIQRHKIVSYTTQQNGLAERMNKTLLERMRRMMVGAGLSKDFLADTLHSTCYLMNRSPSQAIRLKTPMKIWTGHKLDFSNLKMFGCVVYAHIREDKLGAMTLKCVFLGYPNRVKGYKLWCIEDSKEKVIIDKDVTFHEYAFPFMFKQIVGVDMGTVVKEKDEESLQTLEHVADNNIKDVHEESQVEVSPLAEEEDAEFQVQEIHKTAVRMGRRRTKSDLMLEAQSKFRPEHLIPRHKGRRVPKQIERFGFNNLIAYAFSITDSGNNLAYILQGSCAMKGLNPLV